MGPKLGPTGCLETSVTYHRSSLRNLAEEHKSLIHSSAEA